MTPREFEKFLDRDQWCYATGTAGSALIPQHRVGGMGGNRPQSPSAIITFDSVTNGHIESDPWWQRKAYENGWKLRSGFDTLQCPVWHVRRGWLMLDDEFGVRAATTDEIAEFKERVR